VLAKMDHYLFISSTDSKDWFPQNNSQNFRIKLPSSLKLDGLWRCALTEFSYTPIFEGLIPKEIYICCDIVQDSYACNSTLPLLRKVNVPSQHSSRIQILFPQNFYIPVSQEEIQYINMYIKDENLQNPSFGSEPVTCTLHLWRDLNYLKK
jgi:hypothetical protein